VRPKKKLTRARSALQQYKQTAAFGIGQTRAEKKDQADALEAAIIQQTHEIVFLLHERCQVCAGLRRGECDGRPDEMHEDPPRSATRGMAPYLRFNILVCGRLCHVCHRDVTERRIKLRFRDARRFMGIVQSTEVA
jgi:hypothetical protein